MVQFFFYFFYYFQFHDSQDSSISIATGYGLDDWDLIPSGG
jgi:hypothetical protein